MWLIPILLGFAIITNAEYLMGPITWDEYGFSSTLTLGSLPPENRRYGTDETTLTLTVTTLCYVPELAPTERMVHVEISSPNLTEYTPRDVIQPDVTTKCPYAGYLTMKTAAVGERFGFSVTRLSDGEVVLDTFLREPINHELELMHQGIYVEFTHYFPQYLVDAKIMPTTYGLGPRRDPMPLPMNQTYTLWNWDHGGTPDHKPIYSNHPFLMELRPSGAALGVFMLNSAPADVELWYDRVTWRMAGGSVDMYVFTPITPKDVMKQYHQLIGLPVAIPRWTMGWHQCRWDGEGSTIDYLVDVVSNYDRYGIPLDDLFMDIDYMDGFRDFTLDPVRFPADEFADLVDRLHMSDRHITPIVDPGVKYDPDNGYATYDRMVQSGAYMTNPDGSPYIGVVWPGDVIYPDWWHENALSWWGEELYQWMTLTNLEPNYWIDMNEPAHFWNDGPCTNYNGGTPDTEYPLPEDPDIPPYPPGGNNLCDCTVPNAVMTREAPEYYLHNLYAHQEAKVTRDALLKIDPSRRPFILTRSSFSGTGHYCSVWGGDNYSSFYDLEQSIAHVLMFNMMGIPMAGADIGGFGGDCWEELYLRWVELGVWYPFSRDHSSSGTAPQEPWNFDNGVEISIAAIQEKYQYLPTLYTAMMMTTLVGGTAFTALAFEYPADPVTHSIQTQFMFGPIMFTPVLTEGMTTVNAYFPPASTWYELRTGVRTGYSGWVDVTQGLLDMVPAFVPAGNVVFSTTPQDNIANTIAQPIIVSAYLDNNGEAAGQLYLDDGVTEPVVFRILEYTVSGNSLTMTPVWEGGYTPIENINTIYVHGLGSLQVSEVVVNGEEISTNSWVQTDETIRIKIGTRNIANALTITWA